MTTVLDERVSNRPQHRSQTWILLEPPGPRGRDIVPLAMATDLGERGKVFAVSDYGPVSAWLHLDPRLDSAL